MKGKYNYLLLLVFALGLTCSSVQADDTDIYYLSNVSTTDEPLVMFSIDWRPNLDSTVCNGSECDSLYPDYLTKDPATETIKAFDLYRAVLKKVFEPLKGVKVGLMINHNQETGKSCAGPQSSENKCTNGGYIAFGFQSLQENDTNGAKHAFDSKLANLPLPDGNSHSYQGKELFFEFFRYLTGQEIYNGHNGWTSFDGKSGNANKNVNEEYPAISWDTSIEDGNYYIAALNSNVSACAKIFTVNIMFGVSNHEDDSDTAIQGSKVDGGMAGINLKGKNNTFNSVISWLRDIDLADGSFGTASNLEGIQNVTSYYLVPSPSTTEHGYAQNGGTNRALALSDNPDELIETLSGIFREILSVSTTFVSASVPVNVFNRAEIVNNVYLALFQPKTDPNWPGNVKKLKISKDSAGNTILIDANGNDAVSLDGRIKYDALTYWTNASALPFPDSNVTGDEADFVVDGKDGRFVPRGGAGQQIPGITGSGSSNPGETNSTTGGRKLYTEPSSGFTLLDLNANNTTAAELQTALNALTDSEALCLLRYARGYEVTSTSSCTSSTVRPWLFGDSLHSRPLPINYGGSDPDNPDIRILVGSNDGFMRMIRNTNGSTENGKEIWAFMPRKVMPILNRLLNNNPGTPPHPYGVDGAPTTYVKDVDRDGTIEPIDGDKVWLFFGLRRGGKAYYALDISDPDNPKFLWSIDKSGDYSELGLTFSSPKVGMLDWGSGKKPVLIIGGGYDINKDTRPGPGTNDSEGNALFIVDAETGNLVWKAVKSGTPSSNTFVNPSLLDSIPSEVTTVDSNADGLLDRIYVGDTGGVVWRADLRGLDGNDDLISNDPSLWTLTSILSVGRHGTSIDRRFFHHPDVVFSKDDDGAFDAVIIGSGDRPNPLETTIANELYMLKDRNITSGKPPTTTLTPSDLADLTNNCLQELDVTCTSTPNLTNGWRISLEASGEKALASPVTLNGAIFFSTYIPPQASVIQCGPSEGSGAIYGVSLQDASAVLNWNTSTDGDGGGTLQKEDRSRALKSGGIPSEIVLIPTDKGVDMLSSDLTSEALPTKLGWKTFWYQKLD